MFLFILASQDDIAQVDSSFADVLHHWHRDTLAFIHADLPKLIVIVVIAFIFARVVGFFVNRMRRLADRHASTNPQRSSEIRTLAAVLRATGYAIIGFVVLLHVLSMLDRKSVV